MKNFQYTVLLILTGKLIYQEAPAGSFTADDALLEYETL